MPFPSDFVLAAVSLILGAGLTVPLRLLFRRRQGVTPQSHREQLFHLNDGVLHGDGPPRTLEVFAAGLASDVRAEFTMAARKLHDQGARFAMVCRDSDERYLDVAGYVNGARAYLSVIDITQREDCAQAAQLSAATAAARAAQQSELLDNAPYLQWRMDASGGVAWSNAVAMKEHGMHPRTLDLLVARAHRLEIGEQPEQHRISVQPEDAAAPSWFDVTLTRRPDGTLLCYALAAERIMRAEAALGRFVETLTETFAHLPIGLAIFDRDRELGLFNPALADLLRLDPAWLAGRPTLTSFLNHLRERRALPDQRDFRNWREKLITLGRDGGTEDFAEVWVQPSGRTLRVVGRPHPQGAVAFLLEDITPAVTLEQQFREGMTARAAALESRPGTHIIFDISGAAGFVGADFARLTGARLEEGALSSAGAIHEVLRRCTATFGPAPIWDEVLGYVVGRGTGKERTPLIVPLRRDDEIVHTLELHPLPGGGTLLSFLPPDPVHRSTSRDLRRAVDLAIAQGRSVTEPADVGVILQDGGAGALPCLQQDLIRRAVYNMLLAAVDVVPAGQRVVLELSSDSQDAVLSLREQDPLAASAGVGATLPVSLLRRYLGEVNGRVEIAEGERFGITVRIALEALGGAQAGHRPLLTAGGSTG